MHARPFVLLLLLVAALLGGCMSFSGHDDQALIQRILDRALPPTFVGDARVEHKNTYLDFSIEARALRREDGVWRWESITYRRNGRFSNGSVSLGQSAR